MINNFKPFDNINFNGGNLSSDGGAILILSYLEKNNLLHFLHHLPFHDNRSTPVFSNASILKQIMYRCFLGYFNQDDQSYLINDPLLSRYIFACSQPTISRFFDRVGYATNLALKQHLQETACDYVNQHINQPIIDIDSTKTETYGKQEGSAHIYHYNCKGYHPIVMNEYHSSLLLSANLRAGSAYSSNGFIEEMKKVLCYLQTENKEIRLRADSAFYNTEYLEFMEEKEIIYYVRVKGFQKIHNLIIEQLEIMNIDYMKYPSEKPYYGEIRYTIGKSKQERRVVYKVSAEKDDNQLSLLPKIYSVVTNDKERPAKEVMDFYEERGNSENYTKELKADFDGRRVSHQSFLKNEMEFLISAMCYNIYQLFQEEILEGEDKKLRMNTFRKAYQKIAVKVVKHARQITLMFSSVYKQKSKFIYYFNKIIR